MLGTKQDWLCGIGLVALACATQAHAQEAESGVDPQALAADDREITVTARKRAESVLKVPVVVEVVDAEELQKAQITDIRGLTTRVPGLIIGDNVLSIGAQISLRGIGTSSIDAGIDQSVSLNIDGLQFSQGLAYKSGLFDLASAQVLKGPQSLFFGKSNTGGVIALTTADPGTELEVIARASYEIQASEKRGELIVSGPVSDTLGLRLATSLSDIDGYFKNIAQAIPGTGARNPDDRNWFGNRNYIVRGTAVWQPSDSFKARLKLNVTRDASKTPTALQLTSCPNGLGPGAFGIQFLGSECKADRTFSVVVMDPAAFPGLREDGSSGVRRDGDQFTTIRQRFGTLELAYDFTPDIGLTSTTGYYRNETDAANNGVQAGAAGATLFADNQFVRRDVTQELRLEQAGAGAFNWLLGGYYQNARTTNDIFVGGNTALGLPGVLAAGSHRLNIEAYSLFGQVRVKPASTFEIAAGVRWTDEKRSDFAVSRDAVTGAYNSVNLLTPRLRARNWSPELTLTWIPNDDFTIFGALKQGYKSGSYSITTPAAAGVDNSFGDERVRGGELGFKSRLANRQFNVNGAFYYYRYSGLQVGVNAPAPATGVPILRTLNAGSARTYCIDLDATWQPDSVPGLAISASVNWNDAKYLSLRNVPCYGGQTIALGCNESFDPTAVSPLLPGVTGLFKGQDASGQVLERAPKWQATGGIDYELPVASGSIVFGSSFQVSSRYRTIIGRRDDYFERGFAKFNAYVTMKGEDDRWDVSLIGNNLTDVLRAGYCANAGFQDGIAFADFARATGAATNPTGNVDEVACVVQPGRQLFLKLTWRPF